VPTPSRPCTLRAVALCNDATPAADGGWQGDPTETALTTVAAGAGLHKAALDTEWPRVLEQPFDSVRKRMTTFHRTPQGYVAYTKGAPESVIPQCTVEWRTAAAGGPSQMNHSAWLARADALAAQGLRVLAVARRSYERLPEAGGEIEAVESGLCMVGLIGLIDPPRPEAAAAVRECMAAGVTPVMNIKR
jgi:Ca2+-transporting ATPase